MQKYEDAISPFRNNRGLICFDKRHTQAHDGPFQTGLFYAGMELLQAGSANKGELIKYVSEYTTETGEMYRHENTTIPDSNIKQVAGRDQLHPLMAALTLSLGHLASSQITKRVFISPLQLIGTDPCIMPNHRVYNKLCAGLPMSKREESIGNAFNILSTLLSIWNYKRNGAPGHRSNSSIVKATLRAYIYKRYCGSRLSGVSLWLVRKLINRQEAFTKLATQTWGKSLTQWGPPWHLPWIELFNLEER